jgi:hypothetical protein
MKTGAHLTHRVGMWDDAGNEIIEHPASLALANPPGNGLGSALQAARSSCGAIA